MRKGATERREWGARHWVMCYGKARDEAICNAERLAIEVIADRIAYGELELSALAASFTLRDRHLTTR